MLIHDDDDLIAVPNTIPDRLIGVGLDAERFAIVLELCTTGSGSVVFDSGSQFANMKEAAFGPFVVDELAKGEHGLCGFGQEVPGLRPSRSRASAAALPGHKKTWFNDRRHIRNMMVSPAFPSPPSCLPSPLLPSFPSCLPSRSSFVSSSSSSLRSMLCR